MEKTAYTSMDTQTLLNTIQFKKKELAKQRMAHAVEPLKNPREITHQRKDIARALTALNRKNTPTHE